MSDSLIYGLGGLMFYQAFVTIRLMQSKTYTPQQKRRRYLIIWLVPFVGAAMTLAALAADAKSPAPPEKDKASRKIKKRA